MAVQETDHGSFMCTVHDYHATATEDPEGTSEFIVPTGGTYDPDCPDCREAMRRATEHAADQRFHEG